MESWDGTMVFLYSALYHKVLCDKLAAAGFFEFLGCQKIILVKSSLKVVKWNISDGGARGQKSNIPRLLICDSRQISLQIFKNFQFYIKEFILWTKKISDGSNPFGLPYTKAQNFKPVWPRMRWTQCQIRKKSELIRTLVIFKPRFVYKLGNEPTRTSNPSTTYSIFFHKYKKTALFPFDLKQCVPSSHKGPREDF